MSKPKTHEMFTPPNPLRAKVAGALPALDKSAISKAEAALGSLSDKFEDWLHEELTRLLEAWAAYEKTPGSLEVRSELHRRSHDLKGLAPTYGYPLVGRICGSLSKLTSDEHDAIVPPIGLLKAHVDATKAAVIGKVKGADHPVGLALAAELEQKTKAILGPDA